MTGVLVLAPKIAIVLIPTFSQPIEQKVADGIREVFAKTDIHPLFAPVNYLPDSDERLAHKFWFHRQLAGSQPAVILAYGSGLGFVSGNERYQKILDIYQGIPIVNMGNPVPETPNILVDNFDPMYQLMRAIISRRPTTGYLYISGPVGNVDSQIRWRALARAFVEAGREVEEIDTLVGDYRTYNAGQAFAAYLDRSSLAATVIVCANDSMAKGVLEVLKDRSLRCPEDFWVTGFDNMDFAGFMSPGLTTVAFPAKEMGVQAAQCALKLVAGTEASTDDIVVKGFPIYRSSTGDLQPVLGDSDDDLIKEWSKIIQREENARRLVSLHNVDHKVALFQSMKGVLEFLMELQVDQLLVYILEVLEDGRQGFYEMDLRGQNQSKRTDRMDFAEIFSSKPRANYSLVCALAIDCEHYGYLVANCLPSSAEIVEAVAVQFSELLHAQALERKSEQYRNQNELNERMASLGSLVSGVAHEVNTPIGTGKLASSSLQFISKTLQKRIAENSMTRSDFNAYLAETLEYTEIIQLSLDRAADLISNFKMVSVDQSGEAKRRIDLGEYIASILSSLRHRLKDTQVELQTDLATGVVVETYPGAVAQVVTNLFMNSINHGFNFGQQKGIIEIKLTTTNSGFSLLVRDTGKGATPEVINHIFDPFFTTARGQGGSGLGMHIVFNLLSQKLHWSIDIETQAEQGFAAILKPQKLTQ